MERTEAKKAALTAQEKYREHFREFRLRHIPDLAGRRAT